MSRRTDIQAALLTQLTDSAIKYKATYNNVDNKYPKDLTISQLPAVKIYFADEDYDYKPALRSMNKISFDLYIYVIEWSKTDTSTEENILKIVRNKLGNDIRVNNTCVDLSVSSIVKLEVEYPLVCYKLNIKCKYEESISNL